MTARPDTLIIWLYQIFLKISLNCQISANTVEAIKYQRNTEQIYGDISVAGQYFMLKFFKKMQQKIYFLMKWHTIPDWKIWKNNMNFVKHFENVSHTVHFLLNYNLLMVLTNAFPFFLVFLVKIVVILFFHLITINSYWKRALHY